MVLPKVQHDTSEYGNNINIYIYRCRHSNDVLKKLLKKNSENTFNAISCDGDTSTNDMVSIFSTGKARHSKLIIFQII